MQGCCSVIFAFVLPKTDRVKGCLRIKIAPRFDALDVLLFVLAMLHFSSANPLAIVLPASVYLFVVYLFMMFMSAGASDT